MTSTSLPRIKALLRRYGLRARKGLGQSFLIDAEVLRQVTESAELRAEDTVVEVGPGLGALTQELASKVSRVIAIEVDEALADALQEILAPCGNVTLVREDVLNLNPRELLSSAGIDLDQKDDTSYLVVANLPYYITSPVLRHFLESDLKPRRMVVMVQAEVAERIVAGPGEMSLLSVAVQYYGSPRLMHRVPAASFHPVPKVESAILRIDVYPEPPYTSVAPDVFFKVARAGFGTRRKQLRNALAQGLQLDKSDVAACLEEADIEPKRRAQSLSLEEWSRLAEVFAARSVA